MMKQQVFAQAVLLAGPLEETRRALLEVLCASAASSLALRLREGIRPEDCSGDFVAAASLMALAYLKAAEEGPAAEEFKAGDLSIKQGAVSRGEASQCLLQQAQALMEPYLKDRFAFLGV